MTLSEVNLTRLLPENLLWENYATALRRANFLDIEIATDPQTGTLQSLSISGYIWNSVRITLISVLGSLTVCIPAAYAFARMRFVGRNFIFALFLSTMMIPGIVMLIPHLLTVIWLGRLSESLFGPAGAWFNNWPALTIPFFASVFNIFLLRQFFIQIPDDLWEAARIDGAGHPRFLVSVVLPLSKAPIMTIITLGFIGSWNALMWPLLVTINDEWRPIAVGLSNFVTADTPGDLNLQMAASVITVIPILVLYFVAQKQFTEGIAQTGIRG
ncbi:MAG: carbohydrate ABC transporter permease [Chloroflexi bacterium]|nr:carbohydrate ABC transporter permease [Chloroflexota bacterium]